MVHSNMTKLMKIIFSLVIIFCSCCFYNGGLSLPSFKFGVITPKFIVIFALTFIATILLFSVTGDFEYAGKFCLVFEPISAIMFPLLMISPFVRQRFSNFSDPFHSFTIVLTFSTVVFATWIVRVFKKRGDFCKFYNKIFMGFVPIVIVNYFFLFIFSRLKYFSVHSVNLTPFHGEISQVFDMLNNHIFGLWNYTHTLGNILFFTLISLTVLAFKTDSRKSLFNILSLAIPVALSIFTEVFQYVFNCGDTDIDDILLNSFGALLGIIIYYICFNKIISEDNKCWE